jgi:ribosomal 50S subunit-recycling heat shock protein
LSVGSQAAVPLQFSQAEAVDGKYKRKLNGDMKMRLDKYLKLSRIVKRRTVAKEACDSGRVEVNGRLAKAGLEIKIGDTVQIRFGGKILTVRVTDLRENVRKEDADALYEVIGQVLTPREQDENF